MTFAAETITSTERFEELHGEWDALLLTKRSTDTTFWLHTGYGQNESDSTPFFAYPLNP